MRDRFVRVVVVSNLTTIVLAIASTYVWYRQSRICTYGFWFDASNVAGDLILAAWLMGLLVVTAGCFILRLNMSRSMSYIAASAFIAPTLLLARSWFFGPSCSG
jgi:hypothetical protein